MKGAGVMTLAAHSLSSNTVTQACCSVLQRVALCCCVLQCGKITLVQNASSELA